nr:nucleoside triphosphate pyrophosphatase [Marinicella sp. NBU2979]
MASSSRYRAKLLQRLQLPFACHAPNIDETPLQGESPAALAMRLSVKKAQAVAATQPEAIVIGSDQVCAFEGQVLGKPGSAEAAFLQLQAFANKRTEFFTGLCVLAPGGQQWQHVDQTTVHFRALSAAEIERYIELEQPLDCAGGFKVESLGIGLFEAVESKDPTALVGLPLIQLSAFMRHAGLAVP